jgi:hypothetical protein
MKTFVSMLVLLLSVGVVRADGVPVYSESVTSTVAGSSPTDTYSADVAALAQRLEEAAKNARTGKVTIVLSAQSPLTADILNAAVKLRTTAGVADQAINALGLYSQKAFYENAPAQSKAAEDQGKHASWVLRMIVPGST